MPCGEYRVTRTSRFPAASAMNSSANSSRSYCVTRPDGNTRQDFPAMLSERVGMCELVQLHFDVETRGFQYRHGRVAMRLHQSGAVIGLEKLHVRSGQARFLEQ